MAAAGASAVAAALAAVVGDEGSPGKASYLSTAMLVLSLCTVLFYVLLWAEWSTHTAVQVAFQMGVRSLCYTCVTHYNCSS
jgi:hypothetical protein